MSLNLKGHKYKPYLGRDIARGYLGNTLVYTNGETFYKFTSHPYTVTTEKDFLQINKINDTLFQLRNTSTFNGCYVVTFEQYDAGLDDVTENPDKVVYNSQWSNYSRSTAIYKSNKYDYWATDYDNGSYYTPYKFLGTEQIYYDFYPKDVYNVVHFNVGETEYFVQSNGLYKVNSYNAETKKLDYDTVTTIAGNDYQYFDIISHNGKTYVKPHSSSRYWQHYEIDETTQEVVKVTKSNNIAMFLLNNTLYYLHDNKNTSKPIISVRNFETDEVLLEMKGNANNILGTGLNWADIFVIGNNVYYSNLRLTYNNGTFSYETFPYKWIKAEFNKDITLVANGDIIYFYNHITNRFTQSISLKRFPTESFCLIGGKIITNNRWYSIDEI